MWRVRFARGRQARLIRFDVGAGIVAGQAGLPGRVEQLRDRRDVGRWRVQQPHHVGRQLVQPLAGCAQVGTGERAGLAGRPLAPGEKALPGLDDGSPTQLA
ncbi:hypothetical protein [Amycolatopsis suaedae]|uniref:hypothetical protein n=1 Tax=Amycolatopsis suaedae TaxID=2510978 RepID=UPI0013EEFA3E|nr:hypothetical protein [Amycolatopsis suaedae]